MNIGRHPRRAVGLLLAALVAGCAAPSVTERPAPASPGVLSAFLGKTALSAKDLRDLPGLPDDEQRRRLDVVLASYPDDLAARILRTQAEVMLKDFPAVIADTEFVLANSSLDRNPRQWVLDWRAESLIQVGRALDAIVVANAALAIDGSDPEALFARGWAQYQIDGDQGEGALADLNRGLELEPDEGIAHFRRGTILQRRGELDLAAKDLERAVELAPNDAPSHIQYGALLFQCHDFYHALAQFDAAARLMPSDAYAWAWRAQTDLALKRDADAAADDRHADDLGAAAGNLADVRRHLADVLADEHDYVTAAGEYQRSMALHADPSVAFWLARTLWYSGRFAEAAASFREHAVAPVSGDYAALWLFVMRGRADPGDEAAAKIELAALVPTHQPRIWTDTLVDLMLARTSLDKALAEADMAETYKLRAGRRCEADYYAAEQLLMRGQDEKAGRLLEEAYWVCPLTYLEAPAVAAEKLRLDARTPAR